MQTINKTTAKELIKDSKGLIFSTTFTKKDGSHRLLSYYSLKACINANKYIIK